MLPDATLERKWDVSTPALESLSLHLSTLWMHQGDWGSWLALIKALVDASIHQCSIGNLTRAITHLAPLLMGTLRAASGHATHHQTIPTSFLNALLDITLSVPLRFAALEPVKPADANGESTSDALYAASMVQHYHLVDALFIDDLPLFTQHLTLALSRALLSKQSLAQSSTQPADAWTQLISDATLLNPTQHALEFTDDPFVNMAIECLGDITAKEDEEELFNPLIGIGCLALQCGTLVALQAKPSQDLQTVLKQWLTSSSPVQAQEASLQCSYLLLHRNHALAQATASQCRTYLLTPNPAFKNDEQHTPLPLRLATTLYAAAISCFRSQDAVVSAIYSIINILPVHNSAAGASGAGSLRSVNLSIRSPTTLNSGGLDTHTDIPQEQLQGQSVIETVIYVVSTLAAQHFSHLREVARLCISMLLQRLRASMGSPEHAVLSALVRLGASAATTEDEFADILKALAESAISASATGDGQASAHVISCKHRLAKAVAHDRSKAESYITELLGLFINRALARPKDGSNKPAPDLMGILSTLAVLMHSTPHVDVSASYSDDLTTTFREFWFLCTTIPALNSSERSPEDRAIFLRIAEKSPCLINGANFNYVETDLEYDSVLRRLHPGAHVCFISNTIPEKMRVLTC